MISLPLCAAAVPDPLTGLLVGLGVAGAAIFLVWPNGGLLGRRRWIRHLSSRVLREDALKHICTAEIDGEPATRQSVAGALEIGINRAAEVLADLEKRHLALFERGELHLTPDGREYALHVIRTHRLLEHYLAEKTGLSEAEWHREADRIEHSISPSQLADLSARLGNPSHDPHGDPIPTASGDLAPSKGQLLADAPLRSLVRIVHIEDEPEVVYTQLVAESLGPGMVLRVLEKTPQRIRFWAEGKEHVLAPSLASNITVEPVSEGEVEDISEARRLSDVEIGQETKIVGISAACRGPERRRLLDLGFVPGTVVKAEAVSPTHDPTAYRVRGALIALRREQAGLIHVTA